MNFIKDESKAAWKYIWTFVKWLFIAGVTGIVGGLVGTAFNLSVSWATGTRMAHPWLLLLLPVSGLLIAGLYRLTKMENENTNAIIDSIHFGDKVPLMLVPAIFISTTITHLFGGSAGREGAALQIGGSLGCYIGRAFRLDDKDMRLATLCGMSAVFAALFGTPLTATLFALEVISVGVIYYSALVPCIVASLFALEMANIFGITPTTVILILTVICGALAYPLSASIPSIVGQAVFGPKEFGAISATLMTGVYLGQALYAPVMSACLATEGGFTTGWKVLCATGIATMVFLILSIKTSPINKKAKA